MNTPRRHLLLTVAIWLTFAIVFVTFLYLHATNRQADKDQRAIDAKRQRMEQVIGDREVERRN